MNLFHIPGISYIILPSLSFLYPRSGGLAKVYEPMIYQNVHLAQKTPVRVNLLHIVLEEK